jgi:hypothetical protein
MQLYVVGVIILEHTFFRRGQQLLHFHCNDCSAFHGSHSLSFGHARKLFSTAHPVCDPQTFHHTAPPAHIGPSRMLMTASGAMRPITLPVKGSERTTSKSLGLTCASKPTASLSDSQVLGLFTSSSLSGLGVAEIDPVGFFLVHFLLG